MKLTQFYLKQIIKEEIQRVIEAETQGPVIPDIPREVMQYGVWESEKSFPNGEVVFQAANQIANDDWNNIKGKYDFNNSCVVAYGYDESGKPSIRVFRPDRTLKNYNKATSAVINALVSAGFSQSRRTLPVPASSAN